MKVVTAKEMARIESLAYEKGQDEAVFMENAGHGIALKVLEFFASTSLFPRKVILLCGKGNNAGDAFVCGRHLLERGFEVTALGVTVNPEDYSPLAKDNLEKFLEGGGHLNLFKMGQIINWEGASVLIDGLLGTGIRGEVKEPYGEMIRQANASSLPILSIDIPSGLCGDSGEVLGEAISADETVFLGLPKLGYFQGRGWDHIGKLSGVDFGLGEEFIKEGESHLELATKEEDRIELPKIVRSRHKYQAGMTTLVGGSKTIFGAPLMASLGALRSGAGMVHLFYPEEAKTIPLKAPLPLMASPLNAENLKQALERINQSRCLVIGMGLGTDPQASKLFSSLIEEVKVPLVIDADGLNLLSLSPKLSLPPNTLITPHLGEMKRLLQIDGPVELNLEFLTKCREFSKEKNIAILLKSYCYFLIDHRLKATKVVLGGDPGIAKGGSGDVLSGVIGSLISQGQSEIQAALVAASLQVAAGDLAVKEKSSYGVLPTDIIDKIPEAILSL